MLAGHSTGPQAPHEGAQDSVFLRTHAPQAGPERAQHPLTVRVLPKPVDFAQAAARLFHIAVQNAGSQGRVDLSSVTAYLQQDRTSNPRDVMYLVRNFILVQCQQRLTPQIEAALVELLAPFNITEQVYSQVDALSIP